MYHRKSKGIPPPKKKSLISASLTTLKSLTLLITTICGKFLKRWAYQTTHHTCLQRNQYADKEATVRTKHGTTDWFQIGKGVRQGCNHPTYLTYMQSTSLKCRDGWITNWNQDFWEKYQQPQICWWYCFSSTKWGRIKEPLDESERGEWKSWLKTKHSRNLGHGIWSHHFMANRWGNSGNSDRFYFLGLQNHCGWWLLRWN